MDPASCGDRQSRCRRRPTRGRGDSQSDTSRRAERYELNYEPCDQLSKSWRRPMHGSQALLKRKTDFEPATFGLGKPPFAVRLGSMGGSSMLEPPVRGSDLRSSGHVSGHGLSTEVGRASFCPERSGGVPSSSSSGSRIHAGSDRPRGRCRRFCSSSKPVVLLAAASRSPSSKNEQRGSAWTTVPRCA
jgi:hypothetical protein